MKPLIIFASLWIGVISTFYSSGIVTYNECSDEACGENCGARDRLHGVPFDGMCRWNEEFRIWEAHLCDSKNFYMWRTWDVDHCDGPPSRVYTSGVCYWDEYEQLYYYFECFGLKEGHETDTNNIHWSVYLTIALLVFLIGILSGYLLNKKGKYSHCRYSVASIQSTQLLIEA